MKRFISLCGGVATVLATVVIAPTSAVATSANSPFDSSFGTNGMVVTGIPLQKSQSFASDIISDTSGNMFVLYQASGGNDGNSVTIGKLTADGTPVTQFGTNGRTTPTKLYGAHLALQNDQKIILAGFSYSNNQSNITVQRFNSNGTLDTTFGTNGEFVIPEFPGKGFYGSDVLVAVNDSDERIHLGFGVMNSDTSNANFYFVSLLFSGRVDSQWGYNGGREVIPRTGSTSAFSVLTNMKLLSDGSLLGIGSAYSPGVRQIVLTKLNVNGYLDASYDGASNGNGIVSITFGSETEAYMTAATVLQNDDVVLAGLVGTYYYGPWYYGIARILANGTADTSFGSGGFKTTSLATSFAEDSYLPKRVEVQSDGRYVFPINSGTTGGFMRVETNGTFSNSPNCSECLWTGANSGARAISLLVQSSDKIVVVGDLRTERNSIVRRFVANGNPDATFNNVSLQLNYSKWFSYIIGSKQQPDGSIISAGAVRIPDGNSTIEGGVVFKFTSSGELDNSFGQGGFQILPAPSNQYWLYAVDFAVQSDGKIVLMANGSTGGQSQSIMLWRVNANGSMDNSFGTNGATVTSGGSAELIVSSLLLTNDGKFLVPVTRSENYVGTLWLYRYNANGQLDPSFTDAENFAGGIKVNIGDGTGGFHAGVVAPNGSVYLAGNGNINSQSHTFIARIQANGTPDPSFSGGFVSWSDQGPVLPGYVRRIVLDDQSRILLLGQNYSQSRSSVVVRLTSNGSFDTTFNGTGRANFNYRDPAQIDYSDASDLVLATNKYTIVGGGDSDPQQSSNVDFSGLARLTLAGEFDTSLDSDGILLPFGPEQTYFADAELLSDGSILVSGGIKIADNYEILLAKIAPPATTPPSTTPTTTIPITPPTTVPVVSTGNDDINLVVSVTQANLLKKLKWTPAKRSKITMAVAASSKKVCRVSKTRVLAIDTGTCRVAITATLKGKKTTKSVSFKVS